MRFSIKEVLCGYMNSMYLQGVQSCNNRYYLLSYEQDNDHMSREHSGFSYLDSITDEKGDQVVPMRCRWPVIHVHLDRERHSVCTLSIVLDIIQ